jgi:hypothetical protein
MPICFSTNFVGSWLGYGMELQLLDMFPECGLFAFLVRNTGRAIVCFWLLVKIAIIIVVPVLDFLSAGQAWLFECVFTSYLPALMTSDNDKNQLLHY